MLKKITVFVVILAVMATAYGCGCNGNVAPTPTPTINPTSSPTVEVIEPSPETGLMPEDGMSPDAQNSPDAASQGATGTGGADGAGGTGSAGGTGGTGGAGNAGGTGASISNFSEGTEVQSGDAPQVESAIKAKYANATVQSIRHATRNNEQVYAVEIKNGSTAQTVYVRPDGTVLD